MPFKFHEYDEANETDENQETEDFILRLHRSELPNDDNPSNPKPSPLDESLRAQEPQSHQLETPNRIWIPRIDDTYILSIEQLNHHLNTEYPGLKRNPAYPKALQDAEHHLTLFNDIKDHTHLPRGSLISLARKHNYPPTQVYEYVSRGKRPYIYRLIENARSKTEAHTRLQELYTENTNLRSSTDVQQRLHTYYPHHLLKTSPHYPKWIHQSEKYYTTLKLLEDGGTFADIARILEMDERHVNRWYTGDYTPKLVQLARHIPPKTPNPDNQWLPTKLEAGHGFKPTEFIQVPKQVSNWTQIRNVTNQLQKIESPQMRQWQQRFGPITKEHAFAYLLGMLVSDASKPKNSYSSAGFQLGLSRSYPWSKQVGEAACYYLGTLGIEAKRTTDQQNNRQWFSGHTPLISWIMECCINIRKTETTTYNPIKADYLLGAPHDIRVKVLQGITDGDGMATSKFQQLGIAGNVNREFYQRLLATFEIHSTRASDSVKISTQDNIRKAVSLPFFLHATGRQETAEKIIDMLNVSTPYNRELIPDDILEQMILLRNQGASYGKISEEIYDSFELYYSHSKILYVLKKYMTNAKTSND